MFNLDKYDTTADYLVLDDIDFCRIHAFKSVLGGGGEWEDTGKYRDTVTITWPQLVTIWLANFGEGSDPRHTEEWGKHRAWLEENVVVVDLMERKMY